MTRPLPLSSRNLARAGGMSPGPSFDDAWTLSSSDCGALELQPVDGFDALGQPRGLFAARLAEGAALRQDVALEPAGRHVLRVTARGVGKPCSLVLALRDAKDGRIIHQERFQLHDDWLRCRTEITLGAENARAIVLEIAATNGPAHVTDIRFVAVRSAPVRRVRFETRGANSLPSTRLRALTIEDYLNLIGWPAQVHSGHDADILVCQKTTPWLRMLAARLMGRQVVYDLDDDELAEGFLRRLRVSLFARCATEVTAGSLHLLEKLKRLQTNATLLENPADVVDPTMLRDDAPWRGRLVWFGMPENLWMLEALNLRSAVTTITRGGAIEFDLPTVDRHLIASDLALLPVSLNEHTRAKNANRLVKCAALGLPFLASDTLEHRRALDAIGLGEHFLVGPDEDWQRRIDWLARDYDNHRRQIVQAWAAVFDVYGVETIASRWIAERLAYGKAQDRAAG